MNIYVGNLSYEVTDSALGEKFSEFGAIKSAKVVTDPQTGRSRGFGFVEMESRDAALNAIDELNGKDFMGRSLVVNEARPKPAGGGGNRPPRRDRY
ncbi:MAG: RNA-binding protein [Deltaproteobacteria bacterium]|nr:RNA-binding protein [Deltaproteobacteria bacterium]